MNQQLIKDYCGFINEAFAFVENHFENVIPAGRLDPGVLLWTKDIYKKADRLQTAGTREEFETLVKNYQKYALEYFKLNTPWQNVEADRRICCNAILNTMQLAVNLSILMAICGYAPAQRVLDVFGYDSSLQINHIHSGYEVPIGFMISSEDCGSAD